MTCRLKRRPRPRKRAAADRRLRLDEGAHRDNLRFAHALAAGARRRSRCSPSARGSPASRARCGSSAASRRSRRAAQIVSDWDGGTRIGDALQAFSPCRASPAYARGALVLILSDGLERGDPARSRDAVARLSRRAWRLSWLTPLAARPRLSSRRPRLWWRSCRSSTTSSTAARSRRSSITCCALGHRRARMIDIVDAHHHIWRQADLPWLHRARCSRASSAPMSRSGATIRSSEYLADIAGSRRREIGLCADELGRRKFEDEAAWVQQTADATGWPHAIVGYADLTRRRRAPAARPPGAYPLMRGVRMQLHWHENQPYRFAARADLCRRSHVQRNIAPSRRLRLELRPAGLRAADGGRGATSPPPARRSHSCCSTPACWRISRRRAGPPGAPACVRLAAQPNVVSKLSGLGTFIHRNDPAHIAAIVRETVGDVRRGALPVRLELPDREALDDLSGTGRRLSRRRGAAARRGISRRSCTTPRCGSIASRRRRRDNEQRDMGKEHGPGNQDPRLWRHRAGIELPRARARLRPHAPGADPRAS